ncbi:abortive phage infection protein [Streptomyces sp. CS090A]|uniref:AIPR family protein n=1 Tax=Streptomyces sp. CS090A TaxID=2162710 RepID=UPI000D51081E|nr:AIPR family protein [Streptomyces sp. CS090A]PVC85447.1 abortive phage infection protein [Streptomyces sp. CS090A]
MSIAHSAERDIPAQVRQVRRAFDDTYTDLLDMSDFAGHSEERRADARLSRALAAHAVRIVTGWSARDAALTVIDGGGDQGIDAIAIVPEPAHIYLVQAKWSGKGTARAKTEAVHKLLAGLRLIDSEEFAQFNPRGQKLAQEAKALMGQGAVSVTQVIVLMGADPVSTEVELTLRNGEREFNRHGDLLGHRVIHAPEVWAKVRDDIAAKPVDMTANLFPWFGVSSPYESYQGVVGAEQIAAWMREHGADLFNLNIRNPLGLTPINNDLVGTLTQEPAHFWYFNNGITILCDSVHKTQQSMLAPEQHPLALQIRGASVVNGAQTVRSIADAMAKEQSDAGFAKVGVRIIVTGGAEEFAKRTTKATNRQNHIEPRDFIALDPVQAALMEEIKAELGLDYSVRRGELEPPAESGCSVVEAACALACAHPHSQYAARIASSLDVLWERGSQGVYDVLFRPQPTAYQLWNSVLVLRAVRRCLHELRARFEGRGAAVVEHGAFLIAHLAFRELGTDSMDEPDPGLSWAENAVARVPGVLERLVPALVTAMDDLYGERSQIRYLCADTQRCKELTAEVRHRLSEGATQAIPEKYRRQKKQRKQRRPNAVHVIIDQGALGDGAALTLNTYIVPEQEALQEWLAEDERRSRATWVNHRTRPILWAADGEQYSPSGLISSMWELAGWEARPVSNQGTTRWSTADGDTLAELAWRLLGELEEQDGEPGV